MERTETENTFSIVFDLVSQKVYAIAKDKGFYDNPSDLPRSLALIHSEASEALEALRHGNPPSVKVPGVSLFEEEIADVVIRAMDLAALEKMTLGDTILKKIEYNRTRKHRHGKLF